MKTIFTITLSFIFAFSLQSQNENGHFLVEFDAFSPPVKDVIASLENTKAAPFMANDIMDKEQFLGDYAGKNVLLWFWSTNDGLSISQVSEMNTIASRHRGNLQILSFANESRQELIDYRKLNPIDFPVIPNGKVLGEAAFGEDLGNGRIFLLDKQGTIQKVIPREAFERDQTSSFKFIEDLVKSI